MANLVWVLSILDERSYRTVVLLATADTVYVVEVRGKQRTAVVEDLVLLQDGPWITRYKLEVGLPYSPRSR